MARPRGRAPRLTSLEPGWRIAELSRRQRFRGWKGAVSSEIDKKFTCLLAIECGGPEMRNPRSGGLSAWASVPQARVNSTEWRAVYVAATRASGRFPLPADARLAMVESPTSPRSRHYFPGHQRTCALALPANLLQLTNGRLSLHTRDCV
jgi:hypothetical protein